MRRPEDGSAAGPVVKIGELRRCLREVFQRMGLASAEADELAGLLVDSELRGHPDHGVAAVGILSKYLREGKLNPRPQVKVARQNDGSLILEGDGGCGPAAPARAMRWCIERARERKGMAAAGIRNWQLVVPGYYARLAAEEGLIGFVCTNYVPLVAPPGGRTAVFGTNPMAYAVPAGKYPPVVLDIATTASAAQKIRLAAEEGSPVPEGVIFDRLGRPTTDPQDFLDGGLMAPLGHPLVPHKGFGLALVVDALAGVLTGGDFAGGTATGAPANFLWALDVEAFMAREEFLQRVDLQLDQVKQSERLPGIDELHLPGERAARRHRELTQQGTVPVAPESWRVLAAACDSVSAPLPQVL